MYVDTISIELNREIGNVDHMPNPTWSTRKLVSYVRHENTRKVQR